MEDCGVLEYVVSVVKTQRYIVAAIVMPIVRYVEIVCEMDIATIRFTWLR